MRHLVDQDVPCHAFDRGGVGGGDVERRFVAVVGRVGGERVVFVDDGAAGTHGAWGHVTGGADAQDQVFGFLVDVVVHRRDGDRRCAGRAFRDLDIEAVGKQGLDRGRVGHGLYRAVGVGVDDLGHVGGADCAGQADVCHGVEVARVGLRHLVDQDVPCHAFDRAGVGGGDVERRFVAARLVLERAIGCC